MAPFNVWGKVCIAPIHVRSKVCKFAPHMDGSNAYFAPHMEGRHADFTPHMEQRHSFRDKIIAETAIVLPIFKGNYWKPPISYKFIWPMWPLLGMKIFWGRVPLNSLIVQPRTVRLRVHYSIDKFLGSAIKVRSKSISL